jgi:hypothetical protein
MQGCRHSPQQTEKSGVKFKILKCSKQSLSSFPQQSTLATTTEKYNILKNEMTKANPISYFQSLEFWVPDLYKKKSAML